MFSFEIFRWRSPLRVLASLWLGALLLVLLMITMACATVYESGHGTERALSEFYTSPWFLVLLALLAVNLLAAIVIRFPLLKMKMGFFVTHVSVVLIMVGAVVTKLIGFDGQVPIWEGETATAARVSGESITIADLSSGETTQIALEKKLSRASGMVEEVKDGASSIGQMHMRIVRYLPNSVQTTKIVNDAPVQRTAVEVSLSQSHPGEPIWVFAQDKVTLHGIPIAVTTATDEDELRRILEEENAEKHGTSIGTLKLRIGDEVFEIPAEDCRDSAARIGNSPYTVQLLEYYPHASVGTDRKIKNASERPENPAVRLKVSGPDGEGERLAFAQFPDFQSMRGEPACPNVDITFVASGEAPTKTYTPVEVLTAPQGSMFVRFTTIDVVPIVYEVKQGVPIKTPWHGMLFTVHRRFDHARSEEIVELADPIQNQRVPAVQLALRNGDSESRIGVRKYDNKRTQLGNHFYQITYADRTAPLGLGVRLDKFTVGYYPGSRRPRSFESQITITDPATGREQARVISMNHPTSFGGYTFYQSSYQQSGDRTMSVLSVAKDPGKPIVFAGYIGLIGGMVWVLCIRMRDSRRVGVSGTLGIETTGIGIPPRARENISLLAPGDHCMEGRLAGVGTAVRQTNRLSSPTAGGNHSGSKPQGLSMLILLLISLISTCLPATINASMPTPPEHPNLSTKPELLEHLKLPEHLDLSELCGLCVQHDGRWPPLDTVARDYVESVTGYERFQEQDPLLIFLAWTFQPEFWMQQPVISIRNAELRRELELPADRTQFSFTELLEHEKLRAEIDKLAKRSQDKKMDPLESKVSDIHDRLLQLQTVFRGRAICPIPDASNPLGFWKSFDREQQRDHSTASQNAQGVQKAQEAWVALGTAFRDQDETAFRAASTQLTTALQGLPAAYRPAPKLLSKELRFNRTQPFRTAWKVMIVGTLLAAVPILVRKRWFDVVAFIGMIAGFALLTYGLVLRGQIAGHLPAANMYESMLFLSWGTSAFAIISMWLFKDRTVPLSASAMGALALILADCLPIDHFIRPIAPVLLDTVWMTIHVPEVMVSYSVLALTMLIAHIQLAVMAVSPRAQRLSVRIDTLHYWYMYVGSLLLAVGIITGSMWAASSWGRYWGWDPKEVWSLVALLGYLTILHVRIDYEKVPWWLYAIGALLTLAALVVIIPKLAPLTSGKLAMLGGALIGMAVLIFAKGRFATAAKSILCFWLVVMTYVGVNFVLGIGLHSYGFGTGAVVRYMFLLGGIEIAFVLVCTVIYLIRRERTGTSSAIGITLGQAVPT